MGDEKYTGQEAENQSVAEHPPCVICGGPVPRLTSDRLGKWLRRKTCSPRCKNRLLSKVAGRAKQARGSRPEGAPWPGMTGSTFRGAPFAAHNRDPGDGGPLGMLRPATHVDGASPIAGGV